MSSILRQSDLDELEVLLARATPGPWYATSEEGQDAKKRYLYSVCRGEHDANEHECVADMIAQTRADAAANAHAIAHLRNLAPAMIDTLRRVTTVVHHATGQCSCAKADDCHAAIREAANG